MNQLLNTIKNKIMAEIIHIEKPIHAVYPPVILILDGEPPHILYFGQDKTSKILRTALYKGDMSMRAPLNNVDLRRVSQNAFLLCLISSVKSNEFMAV